jgi:hypothetical protein
MSGNSEQWAALDSQHERLVEASHPLLRSDGQDQPLRSRPGGVRAVQSLGAGGQSQDAESS